MLSALGLVFSVLGFSGGIFWLLYHEKRELKKYLPAIIFLMCLSILGIVLNSQNIIKKEKEYSEVTTTIQEDD